MEEKEESTGILRFDERFEAYEMIFNLIKGRRSIRRYRPDAPAYDLILKLIDAARHAPSATNLQPWLFLVITNKFVKQQMADAVASKLAALSSKEELVGGARLSEFRKDYFLFFQKAPVVIAPIFKPYPLTIKLGYEKTEGKLDRHRLLGVESTAAAVQNMLLSAQALELGACWLDGPLIAKNELESILMVKPPWELLCLVTIGFPDEQPRPPRRKKLDLVTRFIA